jgi:hypothetical protein
MRAWSFDAAQGAGDQKSLLAPEFVSSRSSLRVRRDVRARGRDPESRIPLVRCGSISNVPGIVKLRNGGSSIGD